MPVQFEQQAHSVCVAESKRFEKPARRITDSRSFHEPRSELKE